MTHSASIGRLGALIALALSSVAAAQQPAAARDTSLQGTMQRAGAAAKQLIPFVYEQKNLRDPTHHQVITENFAAIAEAAANIRTHATRLGQDFEVNGSAIAHDIGEATKHYNAKAYDEALYRLGNVIDSCINCHSGKASGPTPSFDITAGLDISALDRVQKARLLTASRHFDEALAAYEQILRAQDFQWYELSHDSALLDYLILGIRVTGRFEQTAKLLSEVAKKPELPAYLSVYLRAWIDSANRLTKDKALSKPSLKTAQQLMQTAKGVMDYQADRTGLVYLLQAGGLLRQVIADPKTTHADKSEAYLQLGMIEIIGGRSFWISQAADYLETAIRLNPRSESAQKAYAYLEEHLIVFAFTVNSERLPPADLTARLKELRPMAYGPKSH